MISIHIEVYQFCCDIYALDRVGNIVDCGQTLRARGGESGLTRNETTSCGLTMAPIFQRIARVSS